MMRTGFLSCVVCAQDLCERCSKQVCRESFTCAHVLAGCYPLCADVADCCWLYRSGFRYYATHRLRRGDRHLQGGRLYNQAGWLPNRKLAQPPHSRQCVLPLSMQGVVCCCCVCYQQSISRVETVLGCCMTHVMHLLDLFSRCILLYPWSKGKWLQLLAPGWVVANAAAGGRAGPQQQQCSCCACVILLVVLAVVLTVDVYHHATTLCTFAGATNSSF